MGKLVAGDNRLVWITGASQGLGRALAELMARQGWRVAASARSDGELQAMAKWSETVPGSIMAYPCDITNTDDICQAIADIESAHGEIDLAVLNAGTHIPIVADTLNVEDFATLLNINLMGTVNCLVPLVDSMKQRRNGHIAVVSSVAGFRGLPTSSGYGMTKAGLINMVEALKPELDLIGIKSQIICPGFVKTPLTDKNDFDMPFIMQPEAAAHAFYKGLMSDRFNIAFPWQMSVIFKIVRALPSKFLFRFTQSMMPEDSQD